MLVNIYQTRGVSSGQWDPYTKREQTFLPDVGTYKKDESRSFLRTLAHTYQTKGVDLSEHWGLYTKRKQKFLPEVGTYNRNESRSFLLTLAHIFIHSLSSLSCDRSKASSKASSPHSAIQSFLFQVRVSSPFLKVIQ